ncbi:MAG: tetratricopeptide repeat protein [Bacteroidetes bacterium]|nr:tetratricopeptide repeat protein [Bacteroidota bacterium]
MAKEINDEPILDVEQAFSKTELYIEQNKKTIGLILGAIVVLVGGYLAYKYWYVAGEETKARAEMFVAEDYFGKDSVDYAMNGDKNGSVGFVQIVDDYGITPSGNLAEYYLGVCYLKKGQYEEAITHFGKFNGNDQILGPLATACIGDANMELGKTDEAITYYLKAAEQNNNQFNSPICLKKAGLAYEEKQNYVDAIKIYERIKNEYAETNEGREMEKFISRAKVLGNL